MSFRETGALPVTIGRPVSFRRDEESRTACSAGRLLGQQGKGQAHAGAAISPRGAVWRLGSGGTGKPACRGAGFHGMRARDPLANLQLSALGNCATLA